MSSKNMNENEIEERHISKGLIFVSIVLFPLIPFVFIYRQRRLSSKIRGLLIIVWFLILTGIYQYACVAQGPVVSSITTPVSTLTCQVGSTKQLEYKINPQDDNLIITNIKFTSSDRSKATVDENGLVTMTSPGKVTITIRVQDNHYQERTKKIKLLIIE